MSWASASAAITAKAAGYLLGGAGLGPPITGVTAVAGTEGFAQRFAAGTVYWSFLYGACVVGNEVDARYRELGGPAPRPDGWLGVPIGDEVPVASGGYVRFEFQGAGLAYHPAHGTHVVYGLIGEHYWHVLGGPAGAWGFPLTDEYQDGNGRASDFERGTLFWSPDGDGILEIYASDPDASGQPAAPAGATLTAADGQAVKQRWDTSGGYRTHETDQDRRTRAYQVWRERADQAASHPPAQRRTQWQDWLTADEERQRWELRREGAEPARPGPQPDGMGDPPPRPAFRKVIRYEVTMPDGTAYQFEDDRVPKGRYFRNDTGVKKGGQKLPTIADLDQLFREAGVTDPRMIAMMKAVSGHEGGFEAVNTYDTGFVSVGYIQFTTGAEGKGSLFGLLRRLKAADPAAFRASFTDLGVDAGASSVVVVDLTSGALRSGPDAVRAIMDDKRLTAVFHHAGLRSRAFRVQQIRHARDQFWLAPKQFRVRTTVQEAGSSREVTIEGTFEQVLRSEAGKTALFDRAVQFGGGGARAVFREAAQRLIRDHRVRTLPDLAAQERRIVARLKNRHDVFGDAELSQPADPPD